MIGHELEGLDGEAIVRFVRALGKHRYVAGRLHLVHAFAVDAAHAATADPALDEAAAWAKRVFSGPIDTASRDERLYRKASDAELVAVLDAFWAAGERSEVARDRLREHLAAIDALPDPDVLPFDETREDEMFPVLVDAGWELVSIASFDPERHKGAIQALKDAAGDDIGWESAKFEEENAVPPRTTLHELPALGATELLASPTSFVLWTEGREAYVDYVLRGVLRAAKIETD